MSNHSHLNGSEDYSRCPIPNTHRSLVEAHLLWHQALEQYQEPDAFRANLNATIQALRGVTFKLKSEQHDFVDFEKWYRPWEERLRADPVCKWASEARTTVVHQGELETSSTAVVKLVTWRDDVLTELSFPPNAPPSLILSNIPLVELVEKAKIPQGDMKSAAILIERRWSVADLDGREILESLAQVYGVLAQLVLEAHINLGHSQCIPVDRAHVHFPSTYYRTSTLECMALGVESRTHKFKLATGDQLVVQSSTPFAPDPATIAARYGLGEKDQIAKWETADPLLFAERILYTAKRMLRKDKTHVRLMFIRDGRGIWRIRSLNASNRTEKHLLMRMAARIIESIGGDALIDVSEVWVVKGDALTRVRDLERIHEVAGREEELQVTVAMREGTIRTYVTPFTRGPFGGIKLGDTSRHDRDEYWPNYLEPIFEVWRRQGSTILPDGRRIPRLWEPDPLDLCVCGEPKRFADCCRRFLDPDGKIDSIEKELKSAITEGNFARAEELARAALAQYVIWIRRHTPFVNPGGANRELLEIDASALEAHLERLRESLEANKHLDSFVPQLRRLSDVVGVPQLSARLVAVGARWLFQSGDYEGAVRELETLGNLERLNDTLALVLATKLFDLPLHKRREFLSRAASGALTKEERWLAEIELVRCLLVSDKRDEALRILASVKSESAGSNPCAFSDALSLEWKITGKEEDFQAAKSEIEKLVDSEHWRERLAIILIDHGDLDEVERVLARSLEARDPEAQLLAIDARLRAGRADAAHELLQNIARERVTGRLQYPFAYTCALVALARDDSELKRLAASDLRRLQIAGTQAAKQVQDVIEALESSLWSAFAERRRRPSDLGWRQQIPAAQDHSSDVTRLHGCYLAEGLPGVMRHGGCPLLFPLAPGGVSGSGQSW